MIRVLLLGVAVMGVVMLTAHPMVRDRLQMLSWLVCVQPVADC